MRLGRGGTAWRRPGPLPPPLAAYVALPSREHHGRITKLLGTARCSWLHVCVRRLPATRLCRSAPLPFGVPGGRMFRHGSALGANPVSVSGPNLTWGFIVAAAGLPALARADPLAPPVPPA